MRNQSTVNDSAEKQFYNATGIMDFGSGKVKQWLVWLLDVAEINHLGSEAEKNMIEYRIHVILFPVLQCLLTRLYSIHIGSAVL